MMRNVASILLLAAAAVGPAHVAAAPAPPAAGREHVVIGMAQEPSTLDPLFAEMAASLSVIATLFTSDVQRDNTWRLFPQGARSLPTLRDGTWALRGEGMVLTWKVKPRVWYDGRPVTCDDYLFTHALAGDDRVPVVVRDLTRRIAGVRCTDRPNGLDIVVEWRERYAYANQTITEHGALPRHLLERSPRAAALCPRAGRGGEDGITKLRGYPTHGDLRDVERPPVDLGVTSSPLPRRSRRSAACPWVASAERPAAPHHRGVG